MWLLRSLPQEWSNRMLFYHVLVPSEYTIRIVGTAETPSASLGRFLLRPPLNFSDGGLLVQRPYGTVWTVDGTLFLPTLCQHSAATQLTDLSGPVNADFECGC
jgi:hypothetical protein